MTTLHDVLTEWQNNLEFREQFKKNPIAALKTAGFTLQPDDLAKVQSLLKLKEDDQAGGGSGELGKRINK